jgi:hypothetical protein|tara:strand:- start:1001 stop:1228 length:228 start_codon:yes stop_codon:yes gene_type:complete
MSTIKVSELGHPLSAQTPRIGDWVTVEGIDNTVRINVVNYSDASIQAEHMDGTRSNHFIRDILYISKEYYEPKNS